MAINYSAQFLEFFVRDLNVLKQELNTYSNEETIWHVEPQINNSGGNLILHLIGNINYFIGTQLGATGYIRDRDAEFALKKVPRAQIVADIDKTIAMLNKVMPKLTESDMAKTFPIKKNNKEETNAHFLIHLYGHFSYHLGQINYHRRLLDK